MKNIKVHLENIRFNDISRLFFTSNTCSAHTTVYLCWPWTGLMCTVPVYSLIQHNAFTIRTYFCSVTTKAGCMTQMMKKKKIFLIVQKNSSLPKKSSSYTLCIILSCNRSKLCGEHRGVQYGGRFWHTPWPETGPYKINNISASWTGSDKNMKQFIFNLIHIIK